MHIIQLLLAIAYFVLITITVLLYKFLCVLHASVTVCVPVSLCVDMPGTTV